MPSHQLFMSFIATCLVFTNATLLNPLGQAANLNTISESRRSLAGGCVPFYESLFDRFTRIVALMDD